MDKQSMTDFEICKNVRLAVLRRAGEIMAYSKSWGNEFCVKQMTGLVTELEARSDWFRKVDINTLTEAELIELGFTRWSDESKMRLIPIWLLPFMQESIEATCINGATVTKVSEMDNDHRFGSLAYGVMPAK